MLEGKDRNMKIIGSVTIVSWLITFSTFIAFSQSKINAQAVRDNVQHKLKESQMTGQLPLAEKLSEKAASAKIVENEKGQKECWVNGAAGMVKVATFPKGLNVVVSLPSDSSSKAGLAKVADDTTSQPAQTVGIKLENADACFARNDGIGTQINGQISNTDSLGGPMTTPLARNGNIVFPQGGMGDGSDSALVLPCNFDKIPSSVIGVIDAKSVKIETFDVYNVTATGNAAVETIVQFVMDKHNDQFDNYMIFGATPDSTNKYLAVVYTYLDSAGNPAKNPPYPSVINLMGFPDPDIKSGNTSGLWIGGGVPYECLGYTDASNDQFRQIGVSIGCLNPSMGGIQNVVLTDVKQQSWQVPKQFELSPNYPNPFNPTTSIEFWVKKSARIRIAVYDLLGGEVGTLVDGVKGPGQDKATFNAGNLASGTYIYRMESGDFAKTERMLLLK